MHRIKIIQVGASLSLVLALLATLILPVTTQALSCATPTAPSQTSANVIAASAFQDYKKAYLVEAGNNQLRIQRSANDNYDTVSEGIAYGMLFAAYSNDKFTFDGLWRYAQAHVNQNGLMNWRIAADGSTTGHNGATDADEDMAAALIAADTQWGGYKQDAQKQINLIKKYEIEPGSNVLKPGDVWGGSDLLNPSYITPSYYTVFAQYMNDSSWNDVKTANNKVLQNIAANTDSRSTGYIPDWSTAIGYRAGGMGYEYGYDGSRAPLRLALASNWDCDATAYNMLSTLNTTNQQLDLTNLASSYHLNGQTNQAGDGTPLLAAAASAATVSDNAAYRASTWNSLVSAPSRGYFADSMRLFGIYVAGGSFTNPLLLQRVTPLPPNNQPPAITPAYAMTSTTTATTVGSNVTVTASVNAPRAVSNSLIDLEVYDAQGNRVAQKFYENQSIGASASDYSVSFTPTKAGTYHLRGGIFSNGWSSNLHWNNAITTITAQEAIVPVPPVLPPVVVVPPVIVPVVVVEPIVTPPIIQPVQAANVSIWWPSNGSSVRGVQPFKAVLDSTNLDNYTMYWQVDGGGLNLMGNSNVDAPHKEVLVDVSGWNWRSSQRYVINFVAKDKTGAVVAEKSTTITVAH